MSKKKLRTVFMGGHGWLSKFLQFFSFLLYLENCQIMMIDEKPSKIANPRKRQESYFQKRQLFSKR